MLTVNSSDGETVKILPLKRGHMDHTITGLFPVNCPRDTSRKYRGTAQKIRQMKKGMRNAPEITIYINLRNIFFKSNLCCNCVVSERKSYLIKTNQVITS